MLETFLRDFRYGVRMLRKTPGFTLIALVTLAVGIGVNTAVFSVVNALLLKPLPYPEPERLATIRVSGRGSAGVFTNDTAVDGATFLAIRDNAKLVDAAVEGSSGWGGGVNLFAGDRAANVVQARVSEGYFRVLGIRPFIGRGFTPDEDREGGAPVAVLSYGLWSRVFSADPSVIGRSMMLRGEPYTIVGVMPQGFTGGGEADVWTPLHPSAKGEGGGTNYGLTLRLRPGADWTQASAELDRIASPVFQNQFGRTPISCSLVPLQTGNTSEIREPLLMLWGAVGLVLLIACVNVAGLLLARSSARAREVATRMALGSGRGAVIRQLLVESAVLALLGGAAGVLVGWVVLDGLKAVGQDVFRFGYPIALDGRVLAVTVVVALATSVVFGLVPAVHASRINVQQSLAESGTRAVAGGAGGWPRRLLVVGEVAMGVVLLVSAGLLVRTFLQLKSLNPGFDPSNVVTATVSLQDARYEEPARIAALFDQTLAQIRRYPGVEAAGVTLGLPYTRLLNMGFTPIDGRVDPRRGTIANVSYITPGYFEALRVPVKEGRGVQASDLANSAPIAVVNEEFARRYYEGRGAVGHHINTMGAEREIVGVVGNTRTTTSGYQGYNDPLVTPPIIYVPATQVNASLMKLVHTWFSPSWVVRSAGSIEGVGAGIRGAITTVDPMLPVSKLESMRDVQSASLATQRFMMSLVLGLGLVALLLAAIGIHGLIASSVTERTRELGIRLALGASTEQVVRAVVMPGMTLAAAGVLIGGAAALAAVRLMQSFLWGVTPADPLTFGAVAATLLAVALLASLVPALRVVHLDPAKTLRAE